MKKYQSQYGQDQEIEKILKGKKNGFFVDIGAHNGVAFSNTYFFEKYLGWDGVCFEPHPRVYKDLVSNRKCKCVNKGVSDLNSSMDFCEITGYAEMLSGFVNHYNVQHAKRVEREIASHGGSKEIKKIEIVNLMDFLKENSINHIDYLSIDTEGGEEKILYSIDFSKVSIDVLSVENNYNDRNIIDYMKSKGYLHTKIEVDDIYYK